MVSLIEHLSNGVEFLHLSRNDDGGMPATRVGAPSGCWTSAESLEALVMARPLLSIPLGFMLELTTFLERTQFSTGVDTGSWPLVLGGSRGSTMATGHAIAALQAVQRALADEALSDRLAPVIERGFAWLSEKQNADHGWGVEPSGGPDGKLSRVIATVYALRAYVAAGKSVTDSAMVRRGIDYLLSCRSRNNGFAGRQGDPPDPCSTARVVHILLSAGYGQQGHRVLNKAVAFIRNGRDRAGLWELDTETYVAEGSPGQTIYNANTIADALLALLEWGEFDDQVESALRWFAAEQRDDGSWCLMSPKTCNNAIVTWPTNEAIAVLTTAQRQLGAIRAPLLEKRARYWRRAALALLPFAVIWIGTIIPLPGLAAIKEIWLQIPDNWREIIVGGVIVGLVVNVLAAFLHDLIVERRLKRKGPK